MTSYTNTRKLALKLLRDGLITHAEAANYLDITRQSARMMCVRAGVDAVMARHYHLERLFQREKKKPIDTQRS